jgi:hypothetical protein
MLQHEFGGLRCSHGRVTFCQRVRGKAFSLVGLDWKEHTQLDPRYFRPAAR